MAAYLWRLTIIPTDETKFRPKFAALIFPSSTIPLTRDAGEFGMSTAETVLNKGLAAAFATAVLVVIQLTTLPISQLDADPHLLRAAHHFAWCAGLLAGLLVFTLNANGGLAPVSLSSSGLPLSLWFTRMALPWAFRMVLLARPAATCGPRDGATC
ncbi:hypothetical protein PWR66_05480 [Paraburkholderia sp. A1RO-5]|uniref:hypothetical protein n=1 Tax=Paraburkholderia sp. A1RO-5 TaxID=3028369 RepID=UPI003B7E9F25